MVAKDNAAQDLRRGLSPIAEEDASPQPPSTIVKKFGKLTMKTPGSNRRNSDFQLTNIKPKNLMGNIGLTPVMEDLALL